MHYLIASKAAAGLLPAGCRVIADGEMASFELPWALGAPLVARMDDLTDLPTLRSKLGAADVNAFAVEGVAGSFVPQRVVVTEYADVETALAWYTSDAYAPLLKIRLATTEARLVIMARSGALPAAMRETAAAYARAAASSQ